MQRKKQQTQHKEKGFSRLGLIASWNLWLMPWSAPRAFSRPRQQAQRIVDIVGPRIRNRLRNGHEDLVVICLQECWSFHVSFLGAPFAWIASIFPRIPLSLRCIGRLDPFDAFGWVFVFVIALLGYMLRCLSFLFCGCDLWDPRRIFRSKMASIGCAYEISAGANSFERCYRMFDNGLAMFASRRPMHTGYLRFHDDKDMSEEALANKGMQYALFMERDRPEWGGTLVINLHAKCPTKAIGRDATRASDASRFGDEMTGMIRHIVDAACQTSDIRADKSKIDVYIVGDFNMPRESPQLKSVMRYFGALEISSGAGPTSCMGYPTLVLDMVFHFQTQMKLVSSSSSSSSRCDFERKGSVPLLAADVLPGMREADAKEGSAEKKEEIGESGDVSEECGSWNASFAFESRAGGNDAPLPPKGNSPLWDCLWLRDVLSDHILLCCDRS